MEHGFAQSDDFMHGALKLLPHWVPDVPFHCKTNIVQQAELEQNNGERAKVSLPSTVSKRDASEHAAPGSWGRDLASRFMRNGTLTLLVTRLFTTSCNGS